MNKVEIALKNLEEAEKVYNDARIALKDARSRRKVLCCCGKMHMIKDLELIIVQSYDENTGSPNGGYWCDSDWKFVCPETKNHNRITFDDYQVDWPKRNNATLAANPAFRRLYGDLFKSIVRIEDRELGQISYFCDYFDNNRKKFELPEMIKNRSN